MNDDLLFKALHIAMNAHEGQVDRAGKPYIMHPIMVASMTHSCDEFVTALLHDVLEDSTYTVDDLHREGIPEHIVEALCLLTHDKDEPYMDYVRRIKCSPLARAVKLADLKHNSDLSRLPVISEKDLARAEKYKAAMELLAE